MGLAHNVEGASSEAVVGLGGRWGEDDVVASGKDFLVWRCKLQSLKKCRQKSESTRIPTTTSVEFRGCRRAEVLSTVKLNFEPKGVGHAGDAFYLQVMENQPFVLKIALDKFGSTGLSTETQ